MNDDVSDILEGLRVSFLDEMPTRVDQIENEVMASQENDTYEVLFRQVHSLKGSAGSYNFHILTKIAHSMEDVMTSLMNKGYFGSAKTVDILLSFIDVLRDTVDSLRSTDQPPHDIDERLEALESIVFKGELKVLVVEPSKLYSSMIEYALKDMSLSFSIEEDGLKALEALVLNKYDLLITSLESLRLNGDAMVAALRLTHSANRKINSILITSRDKSKIINAKDFNKIVDRKAIKEGILKDIVLTLTS